MRWSLFAVTFVACANTLPPLVCPERGGPMWSEASSSHFVLRTDLPTDRARMIAEELERSFNALDRLFRSDLPEAPPLPLMPVQVTWFRHAEDQAALFPAHAQGGFYNVYGNDFEPDNLIVMTAPANDDGLDLMRHELAHHFVHHYLPTCPAWLNEGLAQLYSSLRLEGDRAVIGSWRHHFERSGYQPDVREIFRTGEDTFHENSSYYTEAQALVHLLESERRGYRPRFLDYLHRLSAGMRADLAWTQSFGTLDLDALERALNGYRFIALRTDTRWLPLVLKTAPVSLRPMSDAEVHLLWLQLEPWDNPTGAVHDLEEAERSEPASPRVWYWRARLAMVRRDPKARALTERALEADPRNRQLLFMVHVWIPGLRERLAETATSAVELWELAASLDGEAALETARRAVAADPSCGGCWGTLARFAWEIGHREEAVVAAQRHAWLEPADGWVLEVLRRLQSEARAAGTTLPPPPFGDLAPPPWRAAYGVTITGRLVDARQRPRPIGAWVHVRSGDELDMVRASADGRFTLRIPPGEVDLWVLPDDIELVADNWRRRLPPSAHPVDFGSFPLTLGRPPLWPKIVDGIGPVSLDGQALVRVIDGSSVAALAGIHAGDLLLSVNGHDVRALGAQAINWFLAGEPGTPMSIVVQRQGATRTYEFDLPRN